MQYLVLQKLLNLASESICLGFHPLQGGSEILRKILESIIEYAKTVPGTYYLML